MISSPTILDVSTLGRFEVRRQDHLLNGGNWNRRKVCALFKLLLSVEQHRLHREQVQEILWPSFTGEQAANSFGKTLYLLRRMLEPDLAKGKGSASSYVALDHDTLLLLPDSLRIDADIFEASAKQLQAKLHNRSAKELNEQGRLAFLDEFDAALEMYGGNYLPEDLYEDWAQRRRERLQRLHFWLLEHAAELALANRMGQRAGAYLQALLDENATDEQAHCQLMLLYARMGRRSDALKQYQLLRATLREELHTEPLPQSLELFRLIQAGRVPVDLVERQDDAGAALPSAPSSRLDARNSERALVEGTDSHAQGEPGTISIRSERKLYPELVFAANGAIAGHQLLNIALPGRAEELQQLQAAYLQACRGQQRVCFISGEPGIGKTRLAREFTRWLEETQQTTALWGYCFETECSLPYQPIADAINSHMRAYSQQQLRSLLGSSAVDLAKITPELRSKLPDLPQPASFGPEIECHNLYEAVARYFNTLSSERPIVVVLDDMQRADAGTIQLLSYLAAQDASSPRSKGAAPLYLVLYGADEVHEAHPLHGLLAALARTGKVQELRLKRLTEQSVQQLLENMAGHAVNGAFCGEIYKHTEGNPLFIREVIRSLIQEEKIQQAGTQWQTTVELDDLALPDSVRLLIEQRLARLTPECRATLVSAAILGRQFNSALLCQVCKLSEDVAAEHIDAAIEAQILLPLDSGKRAEAERDQYDHRLDYDLAFTHDKFREVLSQQLNPLRRRALHRKVAQAIEARYAAHPLRVQPYYSKLANHYQIAEDWSRASSYCIKAAEQAASVYAFVDAAGYMENALALFVSEEDQPARADILRQLADIYLYIGRIDKAIEVGKASYALWHDLDDSAKEAEARLAVAFCFHWQGREVESLEFVKQALICLGNRPEEIHLLAKAYVQWGMAATILGNTPVALEKLRLADDLHRQIGGNDPFIAVVSFWSRSWRAFLAESPQQMLDYALRGAEVCRSTGSLGWEPMMTYSAAWAQMLLGQIQEGERTARDTLEKARRYNAVGAQGWANLALAFLAIQQGRWDEAERCGAAALAIAHLLHDADLQSRVLWGNSVCAGWQGNWDRAIKQITESMQLARREGEPSMVYPYILMQAARAYFHSGNMEEASCYLDQAMKFAHNRCYQQLFAIGKRLRGRILQAQGNFAEAQLCFEQSLSTLTILHDVVELARTQESYGRFYLARDNDGDSEQGQALLEDARATFKRLGMNG